jgi:hypothetical protein
MKNLRFLPLLFVSFLVLTSCSTVRVATDYDREADFNSYSTFAFYKPGIDKAQISDLDKRRILRAIESKLVAKGMTKSQDPSLLVSIFTKERERVNVYNDHFGYGWGWYPWYYGGFHGQHVSTTTEGTLYIDLIDAKSKSLVWQGMGTSKLIRSSNIEKREERIRLIVNEIMAKYPPGSDNK